MLRLRRTVRVLQSPRVDAASEAVDAKFAKAMAAASDVSAVAVAVFDPAVTDLEVGRIPGVAVDGEGCVSVCTASVVNDQLVNAKPVCA